VIGRPRFFCRFRNWKVAAEKDSKTDMCVEHHRTKEMLAAAQVYCQPPRYFDDPRDALQCARATGSHRDIDRFVVRNLDGVPEMERLPGSFDYQAVPEGQIEPKKAERT
jgi:hypothetical protein